MSREYRNVKMYEKEILEIKSGGLTHQKNGDHLGLTKTQVKGFVIMVWL